MDEARKLAEEWESKYKEMQRQMTDFEGPGNENVVDSRLQGVLVLNQHNLEGVLTQGS